MPRSRTKSAAPDGTPAEQHPSTSVLIVSEREALIHERQVEQGRILSRHDALIRELFQLEHYGLMLYYDPEIAREDQTNEFLRFKDKHDLMQIMPVAGPSRTTRRALTSRISTLSQLAGPSISAPSVSTSTGSASKNKSHSKLTTAEKGKQKQSVVENEAIISAKARGKRKARDDSFGSASNPEFKTVESVESISAVQGKNRHRRRHRGIHFTTGETLNASRSRSTVPEHISPDQAISSDGLARKTLRDTKSQDTHPTKKRKVIDGGNISHRQTRLSSTVRPLSPLPENRPTTSGKSLPGKALTSDTAPRPIIRRIRLIVRPPARTFSSPRQRPNPALFGYSLHAFLNSYVEIDGRAYSTAALEAAARRDARILNNADALKKKGRLIGWKPADKNFSTADRPPTDIWANIVAEVIDARSSFSRHRFGRGGALAGVIHSKLHAHWDLMKKDLEREQVLEERRLRTLAKSILRLVLGEWKKAVFHVREQVRLAFEEEEARRGRQHLDAILDQSGQILEKQQLELVRSGSVSIMDEDEDEEDEDGENWHDGQTDIGTSQSDDGGDEAEDSEVPTEVYDEANSADLGQGDSYVEFSVPLNDAEERDDGTSPSPTIAERERSIEDPEVRNIDEGGSGRVLGGDLGEYIRTVPVSAEDAHDDNNLERESNSVDDDEEQTFSDVETESSVVSVESTPFMDDIREDDIGLIRTEMSLDMDMDNATTLAMGNGLDQESIIIHGEPSAEEKPCLASISSKPSLPTSIAVADAIEYSPTVPLSPSKKAVDASGPSILVNGHSKPQEQVNGVDASSEAVVSADNKETMLKGNEEPHEKEGIQPDLNVPLEDRDHASGRAGNGDGVAEGGTSVEEKMQDVEDTNGSREADWEWEAPPELQPYAVTHVEWETGSKILPPLLLRGNLRPYQQSGLEWLVSLHNNETNGILADEMGLGKTIQTIALLAHLACDRGIWGPHLIIVPTSVLLNWEMEFKKFLPGFKILSYHGSTKRRKELRHGWNNKYAFNVCITSYTLASRDQHIFKRKPWYYMVLDEAHMIKNFKSQRWNILLMFRSFRRLLLTGTPLQNNLTELWALLRFLMSGTNFANQKEFSNWFGIPLEKAIELGNLQDQEVQLQVTKLHEMLRPFLLRRMKKDVEKELPKKYEHLVLCRLSKRQRFLYDEFMSRRQTREDLKSGVYAKIANILMQLRKVCNHPDLFEVRPIVTSFAMDKSAIADFEIKELLVRRRLLEDDDRTSRVNLDVLGLQFTHMCNMSIVAASATRSLEEILASELIASSPGEPPPRDLRSIEGFRKFNAYQRRLSTYLRYQQMIYLNRLRCNRRIVFGLETINKVKQLYNPLTTTCEAELLAEWRPANRFVKSHISRAEEAADVIDKFAFATPPALARDMASIALHEIPTDVVESLPLDFDSVLHRPAVKLQIAFPDLSLLQYDCGKLQELARLLRERKSGGHRVLIFTQMTRILDILEMFLNFHGYLYLRLDGSTKIEDRQYITERFNADPRIFAFIASSRSGGVGINLTGADTVVFYDSDFNPQMDKQCEDRAHRIGQIRDVHIYRFISQYTVEEAMLRKANQKRSLDDIVIQKGDFDWKSFFRSADADPDADPTNSNSNSKASALQKALVEFEDVEDVEAARAAASEEARLEGEDRAEFGIEADDPGAVAGETPTVSFGAEGTTPIEELQYPSAEADDEQEEEEDGEGGTTVDYMLKFVRWDPEFFREWKLP